MGTGCRRVIMVLHAANLFVATVWMGSSIGAEGTLQYDFYKYSCPNAERIVFDAIEDHYAKDKTVAPGLLRLIFHYSFVRGSDGSLLLDGANTEKTAVPISIGLHGFDAIDEAKSALEKACPGVVSCADILAFASRDSVILTGGKGWQVPAGRRDGNISLASEPPLNLPTSGLNAAQQIAVFARKGLSAKQMTILSGAHTIGIAHCFFVVDRLFTYPSASHTDPSLPPDFLHFPQGKCPTLSNITAFLPLDLDTTINKFDSSYFKNIVKRRGLMTSDQSLLNDSRTNPFVYKSLESDYINHEFGEAMVALTSVDVLTGNVGQVRKNCRAVNPNS